MTVGQHAAPVSPETRARLRGSLHRNRPIKLSFTVMPDLRTMDLIVERVH